MIGGREVSHEPILERVTGPAATIISLGEAKAHLQDPPDIDDAIITEYVEAADEYLDGPEGAVGIALEEQTWSLTIPAPKGREGVRLPVLPFVSLTSISYLDQDEQTQSLDLVSVQAFASRDWAYVEPKKGQQWPAMSAERNALTIVYVAGEGAPQAIKHAARLLVGHSYNIREAVNVGNITSELAFSVAAMVARHRRGWVGA